MRAKCQSLLFVAVFCALFSVPARADAVVGQPAPAFVTPMLDGKNFDLSSFKGKVVVIHFWATWCAACREEMPQLEAVWREYHGRGLQVLAVSADRPRSRGDVNQVMQYFTYPASIMDDATKNDFGTLTSIPVTYVIGKDGKLADIMTPDVKSLTATTLGDEVKALLDAKADAKPDAKPETKTEDKP